MNPIKIYDYLTTAREKMFEVVRTLSPQEYEREYPIGLKTIARTLTHTMIVEWSYAERIAGRTPPPYEQWPIQDENPPAFEVIEKTWREQAPPTRRAIEAACASDDWEREREYISLRPAPPGSGEKPKKVIITASPSDIVTQMVLHEVHHRAQVMAMLRELGKPVENLDFGYMMYKRRVVE